MCLQCDGYSHEEAMRALDLMIRTYGWALQQVNDVSTSWCYTVGLVENYQHPELVLMDVDPDVQGSLMTQLVEGITTCGELSEPLMRSMGVSRFTSSTSAPTCSPPGEIATAASLSPVTWSRCSSRMTRTAPATPRPNDISTCQARSHLRLAPRTAPSGVDELVVARVHERVSGLAGQA